MIDIKFLRENPDIVKESQIRGVVKVKIPYVAYPTVRLNEYLNGR